MKVTIYGRVGCPYCSRAKEYSQDLKDLGIIDEYEYIDYQELGMTVSQLSAIAGVEVKTVPVVLVGVEGMVPVYIGGFTDMKNKFPL